MPTSKKPRKKHVRKKVSYGYATQDIDHIRDAYFQTRYAMLEKLPKGTAEQDELMCMLDAINVTIISISNRRDLTSEQRSEAQQVLVRGNNAAADVIRKGYDTKHFIATGDQMKDINEAGGLCFPYIDESLRNCPSTFLREWHTMKHFIKKVRPLTEVESLSVGKVRKRFDKEMPYR